MPCHYSTEFRRSVCGRMLAGEPVKALADELSICEGTLSRWKKQCLIDDERLAGVKSLEVDALTRAKLRSKTSRMSPSSSEQPVRCLTGRTDSSKRIVPDYLGTEQSGISRTYRLSRDQPCAVDLLRVHTPRPTDPEIRRLLRTDVISDIPVSACHLWHTENSGGTRN